QGRMGELSGKLEALLEQYGPDSSPRRGRPRYLDRLLVKASGTVTLLRAAEIDWIDAEGDYVRIHVGKSWHLLRETMKNLEGQLDPARFVRIHRSTIVNLEKIKELQPFFRGEYVVVLHGGTTLKLSRGYRENLERRLGRAISRLSARGAPLVARPFAGGATGAKLVPRSPTRAWSSGRARSLTATPPTGQPGARASGLVFRDRISSLRRRTPVVRESRLVAYSSPPGAGVRSVAGVEESLPSRHCRRTPHALDR